MKIEKNVSYEADGKTYRIYDVTAEDPIQTRVRNHYFTQHQSQTVGFVQEMHKKWLKFDHAKMPILGCLDMLATFLDESDPDVDEANLIHAYQTAEKIRLIHDLGKIMSVWGEHQWAVTGDTYPVGCAPAESIVYGKASFQGNPDIDHIVYGTPMGMYEEKCGLEKLMMTWSHDEYMYQVLVNHGTTLPDEALYAIRFHSFYPYHSHNDYLQFQNERDIEMKSAIMMLNECDLYSKNDETPDIDALKPYYQSLIDKYVPGNVNW